MFDKKLVAVGINPTSSNEAITILGKMLVDQGYVKSTFIESAIKREKEYATGLPLGEINVAVPHTDPQHVTRAGVAVGVLAEPVEFTAMGSEDETILVHLVFLMALKEADAQVEMLQKFCTVLQNKEVISELVNTKNPEEVFKILQKNF